MSESANAPAKEVEATRFARPRSGRLTVAQRFSVGIRVLFDIKVREADGRAIDAESLTLSPLRGLFDFVETNPSTEVLG